MDSPALEGLTGDRLKAKALAIAACARDRLGSEHPYRQFEVIVSRTMGVGLLVRDSEEFLFTASDLPATPAAASRE